MADRQVSWKAIANFTSIVAQSAKAKKALEELREEENKLAATFEADSARIAAASKTQNAAIKDTNKSFANASKASKDNADKVVKDSSRRSEALEKESSALNKIYRAQRELDVSEKRRADMGKRLYTIQNALAKAADDVAKSEDHASKIRDKYGKTSRQSITAERDLISARQSNVKITNALTQARKEELKAVQEAEKEEKRFAAAQSSTIRASREIQAAQTRIAQTRRDVAEATVAASTATRRDTIETTRNTSVKKTFIQLLQQVETLQKTYKGTVASVAAAQTNHARALQRNLNATKELEAAESDLNKAHQIQAASSRAAADAESRLAEAKNLQIRASEDVNRAEATLSAAREKFGNDTYQALAAEQDLNAARRSYTRISSSVIATDRELAAARADGARATHVIETSEARINNARQRAALTEKALTRATTRLNGEMNASQSLTRQLGNAFNSLSTIWSGSLDAFKDLVGLFGKLSLTLLPQLLPLIGALSGGFMAFAGSLGPVVGLLGAVPSLLVGAVSGFAALKGAFGGIGAALKAYTNQQARASIAAAKSAQTAKKNAKAIADAQRSLRDAKRSAAEADQDAARSVKKAEADQVKAVKDAADSISKAKQQAADSIASANKSVTDAEENLTEAQKEAADAQNALNNVRADALQELEDMKKAARDASFSQRDATLDLIDARNKLADVKADPGASDLELKRAQLAYDEAQARLSDAEEAKKKAVKDNAEAQSKGIKGTQAYANAQQAAAAAAAKVADAQTALSEAQKEQARTVADAAKSIAKAEADAADSRKNAAEAVAEAKRRQARTEQQGAERIKKAQEAVNAALEASSQSAKHATAAANSYQAALNKLSPAQRQFVKFLIGLKPKLDKIKETAAEGLLPGVEKGIKGLLPLFPAFNRSVGNTAKSLGDASKQIGTTLGSGEGLGAMKRVLKTNDEAFKTVSGSAGNYTIALARIVDAARPLVSWIAKLVADFGAYSAKATKVNKKNGDLTKFFRSAKKAAQLFGGIIKNLSGWLWGVGKAGKKTGDDLNKGFLKHLEKMNKEVNSPKGQKRLKKWFAEIKPVIKSAGHVLGNFGRSISFLAGLGKDQKGKTGSLSNLKYMLDQIANGIGPNSPLIQFFAKLNKSKGQKATFDALASLFKAVTNFGSNGGGNVISIMATELNAVATALGAIASNKVGAAILTGLLTVAATAKVAKFVGAASGITGTSRLVRGAIQKVKARRTGGAAATAVTGAESEAQTVGGAVSRGMSRGISSNNTEVLRAVDQMTDGIINHIKTNLEIHSPSLVTTRLGEQSAQGYINGITGNKTEASKAAEGLEQATVNALKGSEKRMESAGERAGSAYAAGLRATKGEAKAASGTIASSTVVGSSASKQAKVRGAIGSAGGAALMGSMFLPGKAGEIATDAGMVLMLASMLPTLKQVSTAIKAITTALKLQKVAQVASAAAAKVYAAAQWLVNIAMSANPIALIIIGLVALGVAFVVLWKKSETFRKIVTGAWDAIKKAAVAVFNWFKNVGSTIFDGIKDAASTVFNWLKKHWKLILAILTAPFGGLQIYLIHKFWPQITGFLKKLWGWIKGAFKKLWSGVKAVLLAPFDGAKAIINQFTDSKSGVRKILSKLWEWIKNTFNKLWSGVKAIFWSPFNLAKKLINQFTDSKSGVRKILSSLWGWISGFFKRTWKGLKKIFTDPIGAAKNVISNILGKTGLQKVFENALNAIKKIWGKFKGIISGPINAVIGVINHPFIAGYNKIAGKISSKLKIPEIPRIGGKANGGLVERAAGGIIPGPWRGPKADNVLGVSDSGVPVARVNPGEYITRVSSTKKMRKKHPGLLEYINEHGDLPGHRDGGEIGGIVNTVKYALSKVGGPYVWGADGPNAFDCSGLTSASWRHGTDGAVQLTHLAQAQHDRDGLWPISRGNLIPGDLVFPTMGPQGQIPHVQMYVGEGQIVEAMNPKMGIRGPKPMTGFAGGARRPLWGSSTAKDESGIMSKIGGALVAAAKKGGSLLLSAAGAVFNPLKHIIDEPLKKAMSAFPGSSWALKVLPGTAKNLVDGVIDWGKRKAGEFFSFIGGAGSNSNQNSTGVQRWSETISEALAANGLPTSPAYINAWLRQVRSESNGNPLAVQNGYIDVNTLRGDLAKGLLQVIGSTFNAYKFPGHGNIFNAYDNALAAINYAKHAYGARGMLRVIGHGHGYANGGTVSGYGNTDSVKAMLMPGEFVVRKEAAKRIGYNNLNAMNNIDRPGRATAFANGGEVRHYATGGRVAPPDGRPINNTLKPGGYGKFAWKLIKELLGISTTRGMKVPYQDHWGPGVSRAFARHNYVVPDLSTIKDAVSVSAYLKPLVKWIRHAQPRLSGHTRMEGYKTVTPHNYKSHHYDTRLIQKIIGIKQDGIWGSKMSKAYLQWRRDHGLPMRNSRGKVHNYVTGSDWKWLAEQHHPHSYGSKGPQTGPRDPRVRLEDVANRYHMSMWQAAALGKGNNAKYIKKHTLAATNRLFLFDASEMSGANSWLGGGLIKSYEDMFGKPRDGVWSSGMANWATYAMRKAIGKQTRTIFPPWWNLDPLQKAIEDQSKNNAEQKEFLKDLDILSGWGFGYLVDKLQNDGVEDGLPVARIAVKNKKLAKQYDDQLKTQSDLNSTASVDYTKFIAAVLAPGAALQGIRSLAQTLGIADFAVVDMYDKLIKSGRLKKGERTSRLDKEVEQFKKGLFYAATGGRVPGYGNKDTVPAMLTPGEFVLKKAAVKAIGLENLYNLNNAQYFANGGQVYSFSEMGSSFGNVGPISYKGLIRATSNDSNLSNRRRTLEPGEKIVNNYTTINNPRRERSTASVNKLLRKKAVLGFASVGDDKVQVND